MPLKSVFHRVDMKKIFIIIAIVAIAGGGYFAYTKFVAPAASDMQEPYVVSALGDEYRNETYGFSLTMPEGFKARIMSTSVEGETILLEDQTGNGIQIMITPIDEDIPALTVERIKADIPDMQISDEQVVEVGSSRTGLAFKSDNEAFDGASREVWFVFRGNLYQISTYERLDPLLKAVFQTWQFN